MYLVLLAVVEPVPDINDVTQIDVRVLALLAGVVVPLITAFVTQRKWSSAIKSFCTLILSVLAGAFAVAVQADGAIVLSTWVDGMFTSLTAAIVSYYGVWKPTTIAPLLQRKTDELFSGTSSADPVTTTSSSSDSYDGNHFKN